MDVLKQPQKSDVEDPYASIWEDYDPYDYTPQPANRTTVGAADIAESTDVSPPSVARSMATPSSSAVSPQPRRSTDVPALTPVQPTTDPSAVRAFANLQTSDSGSESSDIFEDFENDDDATIATSSSRDGTQTRNVTPTRSVTPGVASPNFSVSPLPDRIGGETPSRIAAEETLSTGFAPSKTIEIAKLLLKEPEMGRLVSAGLVNPQDLDTPAKVARARAMLTSITNARDGVSGRAVRMQRSAPVPRSTESRVVVQPGLRWYAPPSRSYTNG